MACLTVVAALLCKMVTEGVLQWVLHAVAFALLLLGGYGISRRTANKQAKKPFVMTARVKRLYGVSAVVLFGLNAAMVAFTGSYLALAVLSFLLPMTVALCGLLAWPIEKLISEMYFRDAQRILRNRKDLICIGITGSYGKTSVKFILGTILQEKFQTLITPASFNTPMGLTKVIRTKLLPSHQVFVAEMGARHVGDIKELCRLVHPTLGVITSVGPQHLDTFKTLERIKKTKYELMDAIPADGHCFFPDDEGICAELYEKTTKPKTLASGKASKEASVWVQEVRVSSEGSQFLLCTAKEKIPVTTKLLGAHNIQNIALAASVALHLGMTMKQVARGIARLEPVEHRLQLLHGGAYTVIDDAFNSNPAGSKAALEVLRQFPARRIIVTPGMVELGAQEEAFNRSFGELMAECVDVAILVGKRHTAPIAEGLQQKGFPQEKLHIVASLNEAATLLQNIGQPGDVVLFENDLPDHYSEA